MSEKYYALRDAMEMDIAGGHYSRHVSAMTREELNSKSDIAAELGWRDWQIEKLQQQVDALAAENASTKSVIADITFMKDEDFFGSTTEAKRVMGALVNIKTQATDAAIRELKAQGAISCGIHLREWYDYQVEERAEEFAAQLRNEGGV
ncbi:MAG: Eae protein [Siphoviridae sp. ctdc_1]|nr:MAG: Eae protein [Siphoviridae sp. ctdc_1]